MRLLCNWWLVKAFWCVKFYFNFVLLEFILTIAIMLSGSKIAGNTGRSGVLFIPIIFLDLHWLCHEWGKIFLLLVKFLLFNLPECSCGLHRVHRYSHITQGTICAILDQLVVRTNYLVIFIIFLVFKRKCVSWFTLPIGSNTAFGHWDIILWGCERLKSLGLTSHFIHMIEVSRVDSHLLLISAIVELARLSCRRIRQRLLITILHRVAPSRVFVPRDHDVIRELWLADTVNELLRLDSLLFEVRRVSGIHAGLGHT